MTDYQTLVNSIRSELLANHPRSIGQFQIYSRQFAEACKDVNRRLKLCSRFINSGNAPEAVRLAASVPHLLEACFILNFNELAEWRDLCNTIEGLDSFEQLQYNDMEILRQAIQNNSQTERLLSRYRLLSLRKEGLEERLHIIYQMRKFEPDNFIWETLIPKYEVACAEMFRDSYIRLKIANDSAAINVLWNKIRSIPWLCFPNNLYNEINNWNKEATLKYAMERVKKLADDFHDAVGAGDLERAVLLDREIFGIIKKQNIRSTDLSADLYNELVFNRNWIEARQRDIQLHEEYEQSIDDLVDLLDEKADRSEINNAFRRLVEAAQQANENIPLSLQDQVEEALELHNRQKRRKLKLIYTLSSSVIILVSLFLVFYVRNTTLKTAVKVEQVLLTEHLDAYKSALKSKMSGDNYKKNSDVPEDLEGLAKAKERLDKLSKNNPRVYSASLIRDINNEVLVLQKNESKRAKDFKTAITQAEDSVTLYEETKNKKGKASASSLLNATALDMAKKNRLTAAEEQQYDTVERNFRKLISNERSTQEENFTTSYEALLKRFRSVDNVDPPTQEYVLTLTKLKEEIAALETDQVAETLKTQKRNLLASVDKKITDANAKMEEKTFKDSMWADLQKAIDSLNDTSSFRIALSNIAEKNSNFSAADDFKKVVAEIDIQDFFIQWNSFLKDNRNNQDLFALDKKTIGDLKNKISAMKYSKVSFEKRDQLLATLDEFSEFYEKNDEKQIMKNIVKFLEKFEKDLLYVKVKEESFDKYYYLSEKPKRSGNGVYDLVYKVSNGGETEKSTIKSGNILKETVSPQTVFVNKYRPLLEKCSPNMWDSTVVQALRSLVVDPDMDPVLKLIIFKGIIDCLQYHPAYKTVCEKWSKSIKDNPDFDFNINWLNPEHSELPDQRKIASTILENYSNFNEDADLVRTERKKYKKYFDYKYEPIGILYKQGESWACMTQGRGAHITGPLYVVRSGKNPGEGTIIVLTDIVDSHFIKTGQSQESLLLQGLPVYQIVNTK